MQRLEVSGAARLIYRLLGVKGLKCVKLYKEKMTMQILVNICGYGRICILWNYFFEDAPEICVYVSERH